MTNMPSTDNATRFLAMNPTLIGRVGEIDFYEHPLRGDESPLVGITKDGRRKLTEFYELPSAAELAEAIWNV